VAAGAALAACKGVQNCFQAACFPRNFPFSCVSLYNCDWLDVMSSTRTRIRTRTHGKTANQAYRARRRDAQETRPSCRRRQFVSRDHQDAGRLIEAVDIFISFGGKQREAGLGPASKISLAEAREKAAEYRSLSRKASRPFGRQESRHGRRQRREGTQTFGQCAVDLFNSKQAAWRNEKHREHG
jgi:hypothetical protein